MGSNQSYAATKYKGNFQALQEIEQIISNVNDENINQSVESSLFYYSKEFPFSYNFIICSILYLCFELKHCNRLFFEYLKKLKTKEIEIYNNPNIIKILPQFLINIKTQEAYYLLNVMIENNMTDPQIVQTQKNPYFAPYIMLNERYIRFLFNMNGINDNYEELSKNDWELHKKLIEEGVNPLKIAKIIRKDEIEKLQEISSETNFDFNQTIPKSLYESCSFINHKNVTLIDYAAFFGSIKCFKYLLMNGANIKYTGEYAVASGNEEIIHLCEQNHSSFYYSYDAAIRFHRNDIFKYLYENNMEKIHSLEELGKKCVLYHNYEILSYLEKEGMKINESLIIKSIETGNIFILQYFLAKNPHTIKLTEIKTFSGNKEIFYFLINNKCIDYTHVF